MSVCTHPESRGWHLHRDRQVGYFKRYVILSHTPVGIIGIDVVLIIRWPRARRADGEISLTRAGFILIAPPIVTYRSEKDLNPRPRIGRKFLDIAKMSRTPWSNPSLRFPNPTNLPSLTQFLFFLIYIEDLRWSDVTWRHVMSSMRRYIIRDADYRDTIRTYVNKPRKQVWAIIWHILGLGTKIQRVI